MHTVQAADASLLFECTMLHSGSQVDIVWAHGEKAPALPEFLVLRLEGYTGPVEQNFFRAEEKKHQVSTSLILCSMRLCHSAWVL